MADYYKPWISDEEPKVPKNWGLEVFRGKAEGFICEACNKHILVHQQYIYSYETEGTIILHNTEECTRDLRS